MGATILAENSGDARGVKTAKQALDYIDGKGWKTVKVGIFDLDGVMRGKYMARDKFASALENGFGFCDVIFGWDSNDQLYDNATITGWHTAFPDASVRVLPETMRAMPQEGGMPLFLAEFDGHVEAVCPRGTLKRILKRAADMGYTVSSAVEYEFFLFNETPESVRAKNYQNLSNMTPGFYGYSMLRSGVHAEFYHELMQMGRDMDMEIEGLHTETGPGVLEAAIKVDEALAMADKAALFKTFTKILAQRKGMMACFMAKWSKDWPGQSGHIHASLQKGGKGIFRDEKKPHGISDEMRWFIGGQQALMPELLSMIACTVNSYTRLIPGFWAPTEATWGVENRTCALRAIPGSAKSQRVEYRIAAADINPYIALAAAIGSGLWGIENRIEPDAAITGNSYEKKHPAKRQLPRTLWDAAQRLKASRAARALFGDTFVEHYAGTREWEEREYRKAITDWQLQRHFEII
jgi:glutamine synthetase